MSYSLYLWHWPLIVLVPVLTGGALDNAQKAGILAASFVLATLSKRYVEDRVRFSSLAAKPPLRTFALLALASVLLVAACVIPIKAENDQVAAARVMATAMAGEACFGAAAALEADACPSTHQVLNGLGPAFAKTDETAAWAAGHLKGFDQNSCPAVAASVRRCVLGDPDGATTIALVGDSHALSMLPAFVLGAERKGWRLEFFWKSSCRPVLPKFRSSVPAERSASCLEWKTNVVDYIAAEPDIDLVVTTGATRRYAVEVAEESELGQIAQAFSDTWAVWTNAGKKVMPIRDMPLAQEVPGDCIAYARGAEDPCSLARDIALPHDPLDTAMESGADGIYPVDYLDALCDKVCHFVVGGVITHRDTGHLSATFSASLSPYVEEDITSVLGA
ncbi:acyltransferase [Nakamurella silvestris]|nr:acyltransferase [Nakamurella silvestris]